MTTQTATRTQQQTPTASPLSRGGILQRKCASCGQHTIAAGGECAECQKNRSLLQSQSTNREVASEVPPIVHEVLRLPGQPLDFDTRDFMESRFGHDFSQVRVHTDAKAAESAMAVNALAYTVKQDIVFGKTYAPKTVEGQMLLAHELTHTLQQSRVDDDSPPETLVIDEPSNASEDEARQVADTFATNSGTRNIPSPTYSIGTRLVHPTIQRELMAYKGVYQELIPPVTPETSSIIYETYTGDAPDIQAALAALIAANKVGTRDDGTRMFFFNKSATKTDLKSAFAAAGYPKSAEMAEAIVQKNEIFLYSKGKIVTMASFFGLIESTLGRKQQLVERQTKRPLTDFERTEAKQVFGNSLKFDSVILEEDPILTVDWKLSPTIARTPFNTIHFPPGSFSNSGFMPWLIHELTHVWQTQHGISVFTKLYHALFSTYNYGGEAELLRARAAGKKFTDFNTEQQGDILEDYYKRLKAGKNVSAWQPFVNQVQATR